MFLMVVGQLDEVDDRGSHESANIASKIETLENWFDDLQTRIINELCTNPDVTAKELLSKLTRLPLSLRKEYESSLAKRIHRMRKETQINDLFIVHLNDLSSFMDYGLIDYLIKKFGSDGLKKDMVSYCSEMVVFMKETTIEQLRGHLPGEPEVPPKFSLLKARIDEDPSKYTLEEVNTIRKQYCSKLKLSAMVLHLLTFKKSKSFIVWWLVPSAVASDLLRFAKTIDQSFYQEYKITSLTLDGMWIQLSDAEIDAMWSRLHVSDTNFKVQFHAMYKQIVYELEMEFFNFAEYLLSSHIKRSLKCHQSISDWLSRELLNHKLPVSVVDFRVLAAVIEGFGSDCLKSVMSSYSKYMSTFLKKCTAQQLMNLSAVQLKPSGYSIVKYRIKEEPSQYKLDKLFSFQTVFCRIADLSKLYFIMDGVNTEASGSFTVSWLVPSAFILKIMKSSKKVDHNLCHRFIITSLTLDGMWLFLNEVEIDAVWSQVHVSDTKFKDQFHTMCKQIVCEMKVQNVSKDDLSSYLQSLDYQQQVSDQLSLALFEEEFPASFVDFGILKAVIEEFGSDCLNRVMRSYCKYISIFTKESTAQQLISIGRMSTTQSTDLKIFKIARFKIMEEPSNCRLEELLNFQTRFCTTTKLDEIYFIMVEVNTETKGSFTVSWLISPALNADIMKSVRNLAESFYQENKITSFTLDGMWLFLSESEIDAMWSKMHVGGTELIDQFHIMHKQILYELDGIGRSTATDKLSSYLMDQQPTLQRDVSINMSKAILSPNFPISVIDFRMLTIVIELFGSDCLKRVMESYCHFMSIFVRQSTTEQLINLPPIQSSVLEHFLAAECKIKGDPFDYGLEELLEFQTKFCSIVNINKLCFVIDKIETETGGSFIIKWRIPTSIELELLKSTNQLDLKQIKLFQEMNVASLQLGCMWLYNYQLTPLGIQLRKRYQQSQGSPSPVEWIPSPTKKIFRLAMIQRERVQRGHIEDRFVRMTISGRVDDILHAKSPVELEHISRNTLHGGEIILIEGAPGSGKSTLTVHICQRWGKGELFQQFTVVILVQLRDPAVQRAQTIADLLPIENAEEIAAELIVTNGRGVLWILDGWDELPPHLQQDSIFYKFIERMLRECSVIVTSRPISSGDLHPVVSSRIEVLGFTPEEQRQYFTECLKGDTKALEALLEKIQDNPVVQGICYLPLNAAFIVHTFKYRDQSLPNTEYEIYLSVILSCIQRHYDREGRGHDLPRELASLDDLSRSEAVREPFQCLCELAYRGVMKNKVTFSSSDLPQGSNTLSLLQAIESFLQSRKSVFYNFLHLSVQEVLSAYFITTKLSDSEQVSQFQQLFNQPRFAAVFQFYAAITKLKSPGIRQVIDRIVEAKSKPLLVSLLRCLHEAQDPDLCLYVAERLEYRLDLSETSLSPLDCLSVIFFISSTADKKITVNLSQCQIGDLGVKCLTKYLSMSSNTDLVTINLKNNDIHDEGASHVAEMLYFIERLHLDISGNQIGVTGTFYVLQAIRESAILKILVLIGGTIIADLLPVENTPEVVTGLQATNGCGVLWIFDELKPNLPSIFLSPKYNSECSVIVTSRHAIDQIFEDKSKPLLVSLLRCLYEAQDPSLCLYVAERLEYELDLSDTSLSPLDYLSVSFFLSSLSGKKATVTIIVNLRRCYIGSHDVKCLIKFLHSDVHHSNNIAIDLHDSNLNQKDVSYIARMLYYIEYLYLSYNPIGDTGASLISEAVRETAKLKILILHDCSITSRGAEDLARGLAQNSSLEKLDISWNYLVGDDGISHVAEALKHNKQLKELWISWCGMTDKGAASLACALTVNNSLKMLHMGGVKGALTEDGLSTIAHSLANKSLFVKLAIPYNFGSFTADHLSQEVSQARRRNGLPSVKIEGECTVCCVYVS